ncbi:hypothetical protein [Sphingomonas sp. IW22]|uniref:hypothetical protein n=1 Tax=Sphingomonas sp. IW22 TaxID=3242489 RepID=UPI00352028B8
MDLNYLLSRHQIALMQADAAASVEARHVHRNFARHYAARVNELQEKMGAGGRLGPSA